MNQNATSMPVVSASIKLHNGTRQSSNAGSHRRSCAFVLKAGNMSAARTRKTRRFNRRITPIQTYGGGATCDFVGNVEEGGPHYSRTTFNVHVKTLFSVQPRCPLCICVSVSLWFPDSQPRLPQRHRGTENTEVAQRKN